LNVFMNALKRALAAIGFRSAAPAATTPGKAAERPGFAAAGRRQPLWLAYSLPFITTAVTLLVVEAAARGEPVSTPVVVFVLPILLSAYAGGLVPGLLSTVLSTFATVYFVLPPTHSWSVASPVDDIKGITLAAAGMLISFLVGHRERPGTKPLAQRSRPAGSLLLSAQRRVQVGFAVLLTCLVAMAAVSYPMLVRLRKDAGWVENTHRVIASLRLLISSATDAETSERGYLVTGSAEYLEPFQSAVQNVNQALDEVRRLTSDNREQQRRLADLKPLVEERLAVLHRAIELRNQSFALARDFVLSRRGGELKDRIRGIVAEMEAAEQALLITREEAARRSTKLAKVEILGGSALAIVIVAAALLMIGQAFQASRTAEAALQQSRDELEIRVKERTSDLSDANELLRTSKERMAGIISSAMDAVITVDEGQRIVLFNPAAERLFGCDAAEALGHPLERFIPQRFRTAHAEHILLFGHSGLAYKPMSERAEICGLRADGTEFPIEASISQAPVGEKKVFTVILRDITERKRAEDETRRLMGAVQEERDRLSALINSINDEVWYANAEKRFTLMNPSALREFGYDAVDTIGVEALAASLEVYRADGSARPVEEAPALRALSGEVVKDQEEIIRTPGTGELRYRQVRAAPVKDAAGNIIGSVSVVRDVTQRKRAEEILRERAALLELAHDSIMVRDMDGTIRFWNRGAAEMYGYSPWEAVGKVSYDLLRTVFPQPLAEIEANLMREGRWDGELRHTCRDGTLIVVASRWALQHENGRSPRVMEINNDITERKRAEEALAQRIKELARSNADLAQFAYVASHDLKEPLRAVSGCVGLLKGHYEGKLDERSGEYMTHIVDGAARMESLIDGLLAFSRVGTHGGELQSVECAKALGTALQNLAAAIEESGAVVTHDTLPAVNGDLAQLVSLFQNLIGNALKFRQKAPPRIHVSAERNGTHWRFSVRDNGIGIAPQYFERIFGVFQRLHTRREYPGTGIGLALCKKIVERHGGRIWVESVLGEGATFCFSLLDAQTNYRQHGGEFHA
jgi:PAS domain S-box-containing protein